MNKIIKSISLVIISLFILSVFGWMSVHVSKGDKNFGFLKEPVRFMYSFLDNFKLSVEDAKIVSPTFMPIWKEIKPINKLQEDVHMLYSYSAYNFVRKVAIKNLKDDKTVHTWNIPEDASRWDRLINPYAYPNKDLVYFYTDRTGLRRIDKKGKFKWKQDAILAHHSLNVDSTGNFWVCSKNPPKKSATGTYKINGRAVYYDDDYISLVNAKNGKLLFHKSITDILRENKLESYLLQATTSKDPIHLNDIEPALKTTAYYNEGDVFLSIKQSSIIVHYRPSTNKVLKVIEGPFSAQHDIDFYQDSILTIFNNNSYPLWNKSSKAKPKKGVKLTNAGNFYSNIIAYELATNEFSIIGDEAFRKNKIFTSTEGLHQFINDSTYLIEEQNAGYYWIIQNDEVIYHNMFKAKEEGYCHLPNWARIIN